MSAVEGVLVSPAAKRSLSKVISMSLLFIGITSHRHAPIDSVIGTHLTLSKSYEAGTSGSTTRNVMPMRDIVAGGAESAGHAPNPLPAFQEVRGVESLKST